MTKEEKQKRKHERCERRRKQRKTSYLSCKIKHYMNEGLSFSQAKSQARWGYFVVNNVEYKICSYYGTCKYPCNGDC